MGEKTLRPTTREEYQGTRLIMHTSIAGRRSQRARGRNERKRVTERKCIASDIAEASADDGETDFVR